MTCSKMVSFVHLTIFFLAGVSLVVSVPAANSQKTEDQELTNVETSQDPVYAEDVDLNDPNAMNVVDAVGSISELTDEQRQEIQKPLEQLIKSYSGTLFGSLFSYIMRRVQNPTDFVESEVNNVELLKKTQLPLKSFISTLQNLPDKVINDSQPQFDEILKILGNAKFALLFQEILTTLNMRQILFKYAKMGDSMLQNLPNMLADASNLGIENIQQLIQNPEAMAALMPNLGKIPTRNPIKVQIPKLGDTGTPSTITATIPHPVDVVNAANSITRRVRLNPTPRVTERINSMQQRLQESLPSYRPTAFLGTRSGTMTV